MRATHCPLFQSKAYMGVTHRVSVNMAGALLNRFDSLRTIDGQFIAGFLSCLCRTCCLPGTSNVLHADPPMRMSLSTIFTDLEAAYDQDHAMRPSFESSKGRQTSFDAQWNDLTRVYDFHRRDTNILRHAAKRIRNTMTPYTYVYLIVRIQLTNGMTFTM